jgi:ribonuclease T
MIKGRKLHRLINKRFRGLLPIVIDIETSGLNPRTDAILELAAVTLAFNADGQLQPQATYAYQVEPFIGARLDPDALQITNIDPFYPLRYAIPERQALHRLFRITKELLTATSCHRAVLVGHNAWFDLSFINAAYQRANLPDMPFHNFSTFDTATLAAAVFGETVLARALRAAGIKFNVKQAHTAIYDAERTAELFCYIINGLHKLLII